ncbi:cellulose binding domain-containing protein [Saccharothrix sp. S26]|uniref:cellulose binding domain-containing protein n=1 Tax=Saccharothrix sp. S26 TaxID=2907215 RepID=UPI0035AB7733
MPWHGHPVVLAAAGVSPVLAPQVEGLPEVVYWGADVGPLGVDELDPLGKFAFPGNQAVTLGRLVGNWAQTGTEVTATNVLWNGNLASGGSTSDEVQRLVQRSEHRSHRVHRQRPVLHQRLSRHLAPAHQSARRLPGPGPVPPTCERNRLAGRTTVRPAAGEPGPAEPRGSWSQCRFRADCCVTGCLAHRAGRCGA